MCTKALGIDWVLKIALRYISQSKEGLERTGERDCVFFRYSFSCGERRGLDASKNKSLVLGERWKKGSKRAYDMISRQTSHDIYKNVAHSQQCY